MIIKNSNLLRWFSIYLFLPALLITGDIGGSSAARNCLLSRKLCAGDPACRSILEIIPRVCGPETVACSTMTVNKCLAALRTVQGFPYFHPTCLCREPHLDRDCNAFSEFIFEHPCKTVVKNSEESPYAVHALPTCDYAARMCEQLPACRNTYERFRSVCMVRDGHCRMEDSEACLRAWTQLKQLPMFGCICPDDRQRHHCDKIFSIVHHNSCVDVYLASSAHTHTRTGVGGTWGLVMPPIVPQPRPTPPYAPAYPYPYPEPHPQFPWGTHHNHHLPPHYQHVVPPFLTTHLPPVYSAQTHNVLNVPHPSFRSVDNFSGSFPVSVIPFDNSSYRESVTQIQNPLVDGSSGTAAQNGSRAADVLGSGGLHRPSDPYARQTTASAIPIPSLHSTCKTALDGCTADPACERLLSPVLASCGSNCSREMCMDYLQTFYRNIKPEWATEVALCLCKKPNQTGDECLEAQEKLHPSCARRPAGTAVLLCSTLARVCKEDSSCRHRLEFYEQACAVDSDTRRCAGPTTECRRALLGILGTRLRNQCTCAGPDPRETYACLDWQRILWFNPCVVESQTDYHREMLRNLEPDEELTTSANIITTLPANRLNEVRNPVALNNHPSPPGRPRGGRRKERPRHTPRSSTTTTTTTALPPNYCYKELLDGKSDHIIEGGSKRYYKVSDSCSELCHCYVGKNLVCNVLDCIPSIPCVTDYAVFIHAAPAYQAQRGECVCYSKSFICVRPNNTEEYPMEDGVYLMVGYSKKEEELMRPYTKLTVSDTVPRLQELYIDKAAEINRTYCILDLHSRIEENLILKATLQELDEFRDNMTVPMLHKEKDACEPALKEVSDLINKKDPSVHQDVALSMFLVSEVQTKMPPLSGTGIRSSSLYIIFILSLLHTINPFTCS